MSENMILNLGGSGGGASLNFKVVAGNPQPENPRENTIWLNTDVPIGAWYFTATQPENLNEGDVWFRTGVSSTVEFNCLKKNGIQIYPAFAKQMIGGALVDVPAKSYRNGQWVSWWDGYYFRDGEQYQEYTGGWTGVSDANSSYEVGATLHLRNNSSGHAWVGTAEMVDLTDVDTLYAVGESKGAYNVYMLVGKERTNWVYADKKVALQDGIYTYDVSDLSGDYYIYFNGSGGTSGAADTEISAVWGSQASNTIAVADLDAAYQEGVDRAYD